MIERINASKASVLVIGLGAGRQEKFIVKYRDRLPHVRMFLPLGGTIDYEAESLKRPPSWITNVGLEWLYRVLANRDNAGTAISYINPHFFISF